MSDPRDNHTQEEQEQQNLRVIEQFNPPLSKGRKILYGVLIFAMIASTALNIFVNQPQMIDYEQFQILQSEAEKQARRQREELDLLTRLQLEYNSSKYNVPLSAKVKQRISYGQPRPKNFFIRATVVTKKTTPTGPSQCIFTNGVSIISNKTTNTAKNLLAQPESYKWIVLLGNVDAVADGIIQKMMQQTANQYQLKSYDLTIDSDYQFFQAYTQQCQSVIYLQNNFIIEDQGAKALIQAAKTLKTELSHSYIGFTSTTKSTQGEPVKKLQDLRDTDFYQFKQQKFNQYVYIFDPKFFDILAPVNFIHFNKYTIEQLIINPMLLVTQNSKYLVPINATVHLFDEAVVQFKQFDLKQPMKPTDGSLSFCFVSYPTVPNKIVPFSFKSYLGSLQSVEAKNSQVTVVSYFPYNFKQKQNVNQVYQLLRGLKDRKQNYRIKLRIKQFKAPSAFAAYQSAYNFCPQTSYMITSRHDITLAQNLLSKISGRASEKHHYHFSTNLNLKSQQTIMNVLKNKLQKQRFAIQNFLTYFSQLQIFKVEFMKMIHVWAIKSDENQFYQSEASFTLPMLQMSNYELSVQQLGYKQQNKRTPTQKQNVELKQLQNYARWDKINNNILMPIPYNSLTNLDMRRGSLDLIPKIIHQVWFKQEKIPDQTLKLQKTIMEVNKDYKYMLWRKQNLTFYDFPMCYSFVARALEYQWAAKRSYHPWIQALVSYEALYNHGGIYLSLNAEAVKPLDPFLKYQLFFAGYYNTIGQYDFPMSVGREVIGVKRYSYHLRMVLTQIITVQRMNFELTDYEAIVGGDIIRVSLTNSQLYTTTYFGFHLFTYDPYRTTKGLCDNGRVPCKQYGQAYIVLRNLV